MPVRMFHLLARSFMAVPTSLGSNWLGLVFPLLVFLLTEVVTGFIRGWGTMKTNWKENLLIGFAVAVVAWTALFGWCIITTIDGDHLDLNRHIKTITTELSGARTGLREASTQCDKRTSGLQQDVAVKQAVNETLQKQNRDEQILIAGCQAQALKLLSPEPFKLTSLALEPDRPLTTGSKQAKWLLLSNRTITPVTIDLACDVKISSASIVPIGSGFMGGTVNITGNLWRTIIQSPSWSPGLPLIATVIHQDTKDDVVCSFNTH